MAMKDLLPQEVLWRKKSPYPKTFDPAYTNLVTARMKDLLDDVHAPLFHLVDRGAVRRILEQEQPWPWYGQLMRKTAFLSSVPHTLNFTLGYN
jgi:asparagine synthase (glutamine-hydrolysing)